MENPGPNQRWCPTCQMWKSFGYLKRTGKSSSVAVYTAHCHTCDTKLQHKPL